MTVSTNELYFNIYRDFLTNRKFISLEQCQELLADRENLNLDSAMIEGGNVDDRIRKCRMAWLDRDDRYGWLFDLIQGFVEVGNDKYYQFDILGFEPLQYTAYDSLDDHYELHIDCGKNIGRDGRYHRKLSFSIQLSDPESYEGGNLELFYANESFIQAPREQGSITVFSSSVPHRVTPITRGERYAIVGWVYGPPFR